MIVTPPSGRTSATTPDASERVRIGICLPMALKLPLVGNGDFGMSPCGQTRCQAFEIAPTITGPLPKLQPMSTSAGMLFLDNQPVLVIVLVCVWWTRCSGDLLPSSPPAEQTTARQDQARQSSTGDGTGDGSSSKPSRIKLKIKISGLRK
jgi:hypothetical protein